MEVPVKKFSDFDDLNIGGLWDGVSPAIFQIAGTISGAGQFLNFDMVNINTFFGVGYDLECSIIDLSFQTTVPAPLEPNQSIFYSIPQLSFDKAFLFNANSQVGEVKNFTMNPHIKDVVNIGGAALKTISIPLPISDFQFSTSSPFPLTLLILSTIILTGTFTGVNNFITLKVIPIKTLE